MISLSCPHTNQPSSICGDPDRFLNHPLHSIGLSVNKNSPSLLSQEFSLTKAIICRKMTNGHEDKLCTKILKYNSNSSNKKRRKVRESKLKASVGKRGVHEVRIGEHASIMRTKRCTLWPLTLCFAVSLLLSLLGSPHCFDSGTRNTLKIRHFSTNLSRNECPLKQCNI